jgi:hypothetical protein
MRSYTLTLTNAATTYKLQTLVNAISTTERGLFGNISLQSAPGNATQILIGGSDLDSTKYGYRLDPGDAITLSSGSGKNDQALLSLYARGITTAGMTLNVTVDEV